MNNPIKGNCFCNSIRFEVLPPVLFYVHCHCNYCRTTQGAAFVTWVGFDESEFRYVTGGDRITWYKSTSESRRGFCSHCGSTMFYRSTLTPGEVHIARPYLITPFEKKPDAHVFFDHHVDWFQFNDDLPRIYSDHKTLAKFKTVGQ